MSALKVAQHVYPNLTAPLPSPDGTAQSSAYLGEHGGDRLLRKIARAGRHWKKTQTRRIDQESTQKPDIMKFGIGRLTFDFSSICISALSRVGKIVVRQTGADGLSWIDSQRQRV